MRRGEILALRWSDVDFERGVAMVTRTLQQTGEGLSFKVPKSAKSRRQIALSPETVAILRSYKAKQAAKRLLLGEGYADLDLICARPDGSPVKPDGFTASFKGFVSRRGMTTLRFHDLRHTHASLLLKGNIHPKIASERLGHATIGITLDTYSHLMPGMQEEAARSIDSVLRSGQRAVDGLGWRLTAACPDGGPSWEYFERGVPKPRVGMRLGVRAQDVEGLTQFSISLKLWHPVSRLSVELRSCGARQPLARVRERL